MTPEQLKAVKVGDNVTIRDVRGRITQVNKTWFGVMWSDGTFEPIHRHNGAILISRLHLEQVQADPYARTRRLDFV